MCNITDSDTGSDIHDEVKPEDQGWSKFRDVRCSDWRRETQATLSEQDVALEAVDR